MRVVQPCGERGSLKWIQTLADTHSYSFENALRCAGALPDGHSIAWLSPLREDEWAEYRDTAFLRRVDLAAFRSDLATFWPRRGPQWDGLCRDSAGTIYLIEAKAHLGELASSCQARPHSRVQIERSLSATKAAFGARPDSDWLNGFYQYANRLAHLHFLQTIGVSAKLAFLYFLNDEDMGGPATAERWRIGTAGVKAHLGLSSAHSPGVFDVYVDCASLKY